MPRTARSPLALAALLAAPAAAAQEIHDCVIEPFLVTQIGAPAEGVITVIDIRRGAPVAKGEVVARLDSAVEEATLAMAEQNAASTANVDIATARVALLAS